MPSLNRKVQLAFGSAMLTLLIVGGMSYRAITVSTESDRWVRHTHQVLETLQDLLSTMRSIESSYRGFALTGNESSLGSYSTNLARLAQEEATLRKLTEDSLEQQRHQQALEKSTARKIQFGELAIGLRRTKGLAAAADVIRNGLGERIMDDFQGTIREMQNEEERLLVLRDADAKQRLAHTKTILMLGTVLGLLISGGAGLSALRDSSGRGVAEAALLESEEKYQILIYEIQDYAIFMLDPGGRVVTWNAGAERIKGYHAKEIVGHNYSCFFTQEDIERGRPEEILRMAAVNGRHEEQAVRVRKNGSRFLASIIFTALRDPAGNLRGYSEISRDLTESTESEAKYRGLLEAAPDAIIVADARGQIALVNAETLRMFGYRREELVGQAIEILVPERYRGKHLHHRQGYTKHPHTRLIGPNLDLRGLRKDATEFPVEIMLSPLESAEGTLVTAAIRDISLRKEAEKHLVRMDDRYQAQLDAEEALFEEKERAQVTLNSIGDAVISTNILGNITFLNLVAERMTGWSGQEAAGRPLAEVFRIIDGVTRQPAPDPMEMAVTQNKAVALTANCALLSRDGSECPIEDSAAPIHDRTGKVTGAVIVFHDVSATRAMSLQMVYSAQHDLVTNLPNRSLLNDRITQSIAMALRNNRSVAVLFLDLDHFKYINDSLGHAIGDQLLQCVSKRLQTSVRGSDTVSRQGGDEFVILLSEITHPEHAATSANKILHSLSLPCSIEGHDLHIDGSIGISIYPADGKDAETLIKNADTAMYYAKESGRNNFQFFTAEMNLKSVQRQSLESSLRRAIERDEFLLHYQPKVNLVTGEITGVEALIRWQQPDRGLVPPAQFVPIAEDCGLILPIGRWVLREACRQAREWQAAGLPFKRISVNVSAAEFRDKNFVKRVAATLAETGLDARYLDLELTEGVLMADAEATGAILHELKDIGVYLAVDDFGTGYSSLSYLRQFPIDVLKIDQSFVRQITADPDDSTIVSAIIDMGKNLKQRVIAEGIETQAQLAFLQAHYCAEGQGYLFSRPLPPTEFVRLLQTQMAGTVVH